MPERSSFIISIQQCGCNCGFTLLNIANVSSTSNGISLRARLFVRG
jgi:hypothetical protein